jgi:hypothetical protein
MTRAVTAGQLSGDIQAQINAKLAGDPDIVPAAVKPGIVPGSEVRRKPAKRQPDAVDLDLDAERKQNESRFEKVAKERIEEADSLSAKLVDSKPAKTPRRGLLMDEPERDESGKFVAAEPEVEEAETPAAEAETETEDVEETEQPSGKMTHDKALALLRLDGFKSKALEKLTPEDAIELASHRAKVRTGVEQMASELATLKKAAAKTPNATESATASPATSASSNFDVKNATKRFRETYGEKEAETLEETASALSRYADDRIEAAKASVAPLADAVLRLQVDFARNRLERVAPELADDALWGRVLRQADKADREAYGGDISAMLQDAVAVVMGKTKKSVVSEADRAARKRGQPATGSRRETPVPMSRHDAFGALAVAIENGDQEEVDRIRRSM